MHERAHCAAETAERERTEIEQAQNTGYVRHSVLHVHLLQNDVVVLTHADLVTSVALT